MGIDIYAKWRGQSEEQKKAQFTGFSVVSGNVGYLREAYHGAPYVTKYLLSEGFGTGDEIKIPAKVLRERLPGAVLMAMYRNKKVYEKGEDPSEQSFDTIQDALKQVFSIEMKDESHKSFIEGLTPHHYEYAQARIANRDLPDYAMAFVEFVELCEQKEKETGEPCVIDVSA